MKRLLTFSATRRIFLSTLIVAGLALLALMWKGALPGSTSAARQPVSSPVAMAPPVPVLDLNVQGMEFPSQALIGETFCYTARFDNTGGVGYGPYVEIVLPPGLTLESAGLPGVCDTGSCVDTDFLPITPIPGSGGAYLIKAPIGSLYDTEPFIDLKICVKVDENIALGVPVTVCHTPVFEFGDVPLGGTPVIGTPLCPTVTPTVVILTKRALNYTSNKLPNDPTVELPTGLCNKVAFELVANIADTKTLETIRIEDQLPLGMTLVNGSVTILNATGGSTACTGTNFVCAELATETGTPGLPPYDKEDIIVRFEAYVNNNVLNPASCNSAVIVNTAKLDAKYNLVSIPQQTADLKIEVEHVTIQKTTSVQGQTDPLHVVPGDNVIYTLAFQVSENINIGNAVITDTIPNGIDVGAGTNAVLGCNGMFPSLVTIGISPTQPDGSKILTIPVGNQPACRKCTVTFTGVVQQTYRMPILGRNVLASDSLIPSCGSPESPLKCTKITYNINGGASGCTDDTAGGVIVEPTRIGKEVVPPIPANGFQPGDLVTFKLKMCVESGDTQSVEFTDYLPSPIFQVDSINDIGNLMVTQTSGLAVNPTVTASFPGGDNSIKFTINPTVLTSNTIRSNGPVCFEVKFSAYVTYDPFDDNLFLTNIFPSKNVLTNGEEEGHFTGAIIHVRAPKLKVTKGVFDTDNPFADSQSGLPDTAPYDSNATGVDANDTVTYYVTVTNDGGAPAVGVSVTDALPAGMKIVSYPMPVGSSPSPGNTCKLNGNPITCPLPGSTIPPGLTVNAFYNTNSLLPGQSWIFKIELMLPVETPPCQTYTNSASATWSSFVQTDVKPAPIYTTPFPSTDPDSATITTASPTITKTIVSTNQAHTTGTDVAIGEKVKYLVHIRVPEGNFTGVTVMDTLDSGLAVVDGTVTATQSTISPLNISGSLIGTIASGGGMISFNLGTVTNPNLSNGVEEFIEFMYEAVALNVTGNVQGTMLKNTVKWTSAQCNPTPVSSTPVKVVEPKLQVTKTATNAAGEPITSADAGDEITWMITVTNQSPSTAGAFSVLLTDLISNGQSYVANSLMVMGGNNPPTSLSGNSVILTVNWDQFPLNTTCILKFKVILTSAFSCSPIMNQATLSWASIPPPTPNPISPHNSNSCPRTGPPLISCGQLNNYITSGTGSVPVPSPTLAKTIKSTSAPHTTGNNVTIGEEIIYELKVGLHEGTTSSLTLTDVLPPGLAAISATVVTTNGIGGLPSSFTVATACGAAQTFTFPNPLTVPGDNNTTNNFFTVDLKVRVCDGASNTLNNTATLTVANCPPVESSVQVVVVKPNLDIKKQFSPGVAAPNSTAQITITVTNNGTSPAYELLLQDVLNGCLTYVSGIAPPGFNVQPNGGSVTVTGASLAAGAGITITITVQVGDCCSVPNTATGSASSLPGQVTGESTVTGTGSDTLIVTGTNCPCYDLAQPSALAAWFHFDETSGTTANDIGGIVNNLGTFGAGSAAPAITSGIVKNALLFDGNDDYVQAANDNELNIRGACNTNDAENYTIDAWIQSDGVGTQTIVDKRVGFIFTGYILFLNSGRLAIQINGQNYATPTSLPVLTDNQPHFIAVTVQRCPTPQAKFYVDGDLVHTATLNASAMNSMVNSEPLYIGTRSLSVGVGAAFKGKLDELEIFKRVLSEEELDLIYAAGAGGKCKCVQPPQATSMVGWWPMNEPAGATVVNDIMQANNGVPVPTGVLGSPDVTPITGVVKGAFRFPLANQANKYVNVQDNAALDFGTGSLTIDVWFRPIAAAVGLVHPIVDKLDSDTNSGYAFYVHNQQLKFTLGGTLLMTFSSNANVITLNEWQHVAVVVDRGANTGRFVRNGVSVGSFTPTAGNSDNNLSLRIGGSRTIFPQPSFAITDLDELEFFKAALTNAELASLYNVGGIGKCPPCPVVPCDCASFASATSVTVGSQPWLQSTADFDNDGDLDLAVPNGGSNSLSILTNSGTGVFSPAGTPIAVANAPIGSAVGQFNTNTDMDPDLITVSQQTVATLTVLLGSTGASFTAGTPITTAGTDPSFVTVADFNNDLKDDLAISNLGTGQVFIKLGVGDGTFINALSTPISTGFVANSLVVGEFDGNSARDIAVVHRSTNQVTIFLGNGDGTFSQAPTLSTSTFPVYAGVGDFNLDGKQDIAVSNRSTSNVSVFLGNGNGTFSTGTLFPTASGPGQIAVRDYNNDGKLDLAVANFFANNVSLLCGNGDGTFKAPTNFVVGTGPQSIISGDFNGDSKPDLSTSNNTAGSVSVLLNNCVAMPAMFSVILPANSNLPNGSPGTAYNQQLVLSGCPGTVVWSVELGSLPPGLSLNTGTGVISGTPAAGGSSTFTIKAVCSNGCMATKTYTLAIDTCVYNINPISASYGSGGGTGTVAISTSPPCAWAAISNVPWVNVTSGATGSGNGTVGYSVAPNTGTARVGTMTIAGQTFTVNQSGCGVVTVNPLTLVNGAAGAVYNQTFTASGGTGPYSFTRVNGTLPPGLTLATNGALTGTPTNAGSFNFTVQATDANDCQGTRGYTLVINPGGCIGVTVTVNPASISNGFVGTAYNQTFTATGGTGPYSFTRVNGTLPPGLTLATGGGMTGTPTTAGSFNFTVQATDANGCTGTRAYAVVISGSGLMFYPLSTPVRLVDTRPGASPNACSQPNAPIAAEIARVQPARGFCGIPANAQAVTGNITTVQSGGGFLTLYPSDAARPTVANTNYGVNEVINNVFTVGLGAADGAFKIFALTTTDVVVDVTGYYAPPDTGGLYFHALPTPVRLFESRQGPLSGCVKPGTPLVGGQDSLQTATTACTGIPATARAVVGNATTVGPVGGGFLTFFPADSVRPTVASSNYGVNQVVNGPFTVGLSPAGQFKVFTLATTDLVIDLIGYFSTDAVDANGAGLLFTPLGHPVRLFESRAGQLVGCFRPGAPLNGGQIYTQTARGLCDGVTIPSNALGVVGNATTVSPQGPGFITLWPSNSAQPTTATLNYGLNLVVNRHFIVGLGNADGAFKISSLATTELIIDLAGYFAP